MSVSLTSVLDFLFGVLPDLIRRWLDARDEKKLKIKEAKSELKAAVLSGDPDRVARARAALTRLQKPTP